MSRVDIAVPSYKSLMHYRAKMAMDALLQYSGCSCFQQYSELAIRLYDAVQNREKIKDLPKTNPFHHPADCPYNKHDLFVISQVNSCVIHWSRNDLLQRCRKDADFVLFCDDDIVVAKDDLERLMSHKKDIVVGMCTKRVDPPEPVIRTWFEQAQDYAVILDWPQGKFFEVDGAGTGLMLLSRRVIEDVARHYHPRRYKETGDGLWFEFLRKPSGGEFGEDMSFCFKAQRIGYKIYVDTAVVPAHMGDYNFMTEDYLAHKEAVMEAGGLAAYRAKEREKMAQGNIRLPAEVLL